MVVVVVVVIHLLATVRKTHDNTKVTKKLNVIIKHTITVYNKTVQLPKTLSIYSIVVNVLLLMKISSSEFVLYG